MAKKMLIDACHPEETRVAVLEGTRVDDFDFETQSKKQLRGNIYLAKVTRVEPSLQAAFVEFGGNRHGFLAFGEIHPDYYQIPTADREALKAEFEALARTPAKDDEQAGEAGEAAAEADEDEDDDAEAERRRRILTRRYKIQEVIRRRQIMLVQVVKEERGNKGAALTTYLSLAGRYCVLMPNSGRGGGISRKINAGADRKRLKKIATELEVPHGMGLIIRTAGAKRTKTEIKRDYEYLIRAWETIRDQTLRSVAPAMIYEESSLVKRAIRDLYDKDVDEIYVEGEGAYREAKDFVRMLMPSHAKKVHHYREPTPIFAAHSIERQLETIFDPVVHLKSGGYIVINQTEALVAIDVNSGRATRERGIEQTAVKTNLEAADEAARQMRLRDLAGLIVIDFIDMEDAKNDRAVEKRMKDALRFDRARVQMGKISSFGLMELSRQRRRTSVLEGSSHVCEHCGGAGRVRSIESSALRLLRALDEEALRHHAEILEARAPAEVALYLLNEKRETLAQLEESRGVKLRIVAAPNLLPPHFELISVGEHHPAVDVEAVEARARRAEPVIEEEDIDEVETEIEDEDEEEGEETRAVSAEPGSDAERTRRRRRRGRRGGRRRQEGEEGAQARGPDGDDAGRDDAEQTYREQPVVARGEIGDGEEGGEAMGEAGEAGEGPGEPGAQNGERSGRRRRRRRGRGRRGPGEPAQDAGEGQDGESGEAGVHVSDEGPEGEYEAPEAPAYEVPTPAMPEPVTSEQIRSEPVVSAPVVSAPVMSTPVMATPARSEYAPPEPTTAHAPPEPVMPEPVLAGEEEPATEAAPAVTEPVRTVEVDYAPDQESRAKFFARLSRWGKKEAS